MGFFDSFFDGKMSNVSTLDPQQAQLHKALGSRLSTLMGGPSQYPGSVYAPFTAGEQQVVDQFGGLNQGAFDRLRGLITPDPNAFETNFRQEMVQPAYRDFKENVQPLIEESLPSFSTARGRAVERGALDVSDQLNQLRFTGRESEKDRSLRALGEAGNYGTTALGIAGAPRAIQQAGLDKQFDAFVQGNPQLRDAVSSALQFLNVQTQAVKQSSSPFERISGTVGMLANLASLGLGGGTDPVTRQTILMQGTSGKVSPVSLI